MGSSTLAGWISRNLAKDAAASKDMLMDLATSKFPAHWGEPPQMGTMDYRKLPGDYGYGSSTLYYWIQKKMQKDADSGVKTSKYPEHWGQPPMMQTMDYRRLPGEYGYGSSTMYNWIKKNMDKDAAASMDMLMDLAYTKFPTWWGQPPQIQTMDYVKLPEPYGMGSSTLASWIKRNQAKDASHMLMDLAERRPPSW